MGCKFACPDNITELLISVPLPFPLPFPTSSYHKFQDTEKFYTYLFQNKISNLEENMSHSFVRKTIVIEVYFFIYFRIWRFVLFFITPVSFPCFFLHLKQKHDEWQRPLHCLLHKISQLAKCTCMCVRVHGTHDHCVNAVKFWFFT
jgi:hypothetical protein